MDPLHDELAPTSISTVGSTRSMKNLTGFSRRNPLSCQLGVWAVLHQLLISSTQERALLFSCRILKFPFRSLREQIFGLQLTG